MQSNLNGKGKFECEYEAVVLFAYLYALRFLLLKEDADYDKIYRPARTLLLLFACIYICFGMRGLRGRFKYSAFCEGYA